VHPLEKDKTEAMPSQQAMINIGADQRAPLQIRATAAPERLGSHTQNSFGLW